MERIRALQLFENLDDEQAGRLEQRCRWNTYKPHAQVVDFDDTTFDVWFLIRGAARVLLRTEHGKELALNDMRPGDFFGEMSALDGAPRSANITTLEPSELCRMRRDDFVEAATTLPHVATKLFCHFTRRIRTMNSQVGENTFLTNRQRLCSELMRRAKPRAKNPEQLIISPPPLQRDLADHLGCMREAITREMSWLRKRGLIETNPGGCVLPEPARIQALIAGR